MCLWLGLRITGHSIRKGLCKNFQPLQVVDKKSLQKTCTTLPPSCSPSFFRTRKLCFLQNQKVPQQMVSLHIPPSNTWLGGMSFQKNRTKIERSLVAHLVAKSGTRIGHGQGRAALASLGLNHLSRIVLTWWRNQLISKICASESFHWTATGKKKLCK